MIACRPTLGAELEPITEATSEIGPLLADWDALARRTSASPFLRPGWICAWWEAFGSGTPCILTASRENKLTGLLPLSSRGSNLESPSNWHSPEFGLLAETPADRAALCRALFEQVPRRTSIAFLGSDQDLMALDKAALAAGYSLLTRTLAGSPAIRTIGDRDAYKATLGRNLRKNLHRSLRRLGEQGRLRFDVEQGGERLAALLEEGFFLESLAWKGRNKTAIVSRPETLRFYEEIAAWGARKGMLRLFFLRLDAQLLAFEFALENDGVVHVLKGGYNPAYARYSPGSVLLYLSVMRAFDRGLRRCELLPGMEAYKLKWTNDSREVRLFRAFSPSLLGSVDYALNAYGRPLARALRVHRLLGRVPR